MEQESLTGKAAAVRAYRFESAEPDAKVTSGGSREIAWDDQHPFGFLGGLGG